jgi:hypothetical protein
VENTAKFLFSQPQNVSFIFFVDHKSLLCFALMANNQERNQFLKDQLKLYISQHGDTFRVVALTEEQYNEVVRLNMNHANGEDLTSFFKHCMKYIFVLYSRSYEVIDSSKFELEFGTDGRLKTSVSYSANLERTMKPDGNMLVFGVVIVIVSLAMIIGFSTLVLVYLGSPHANFNKI